MDGWLVGGLSGLGEAEGKETGGRMYVSKERGKGRSGRLEAEGVGLSRRG